MVFENRKTKEKKTVESCGALCLLFGCFYFLYHGMLLHAIISIVLAFITCGISWVVYPLIAKEATKQHYIKQGWVLIE